MTLLDECHLGMDAPSRAAFSDELLADFMAHPRTIVISTHLIDELSPLFEEVLIIDQGRLGLQDETESLRARGADVTGPAEAVDRFVAGRTVLRERQLGRTKSAMVYGGLDEQHRREAPRRRPRPRPGRPPGPVRPPHPADGRSTMSDHADDRWAIARLLLATHLPFLALCWAVFAAAVVALTFALALRVDLDRSVWDPAVSVARWFALGYGVYFVNRMLPVYVAHGRTRREFAASIAVFLVAASAMVAALLALGLALEGVLYQAMDWPHRVDAERLYDGAGPYPLVFASYWALLLTWATMGLLLGAGFYRSNGSELVAIALALCLASLLPGAAATWALVRDVPIRNRVT